MDVMADPLARNLFVRPCGGKLAEEIRLRVRARLVPGERFFLNGLV